MNLEILRGKSMQYHDNWNSSNPRSADFRPDVRSLKRPRSKENDQFICHVEKLPNVFFELRPDVDVGLIEEWSGSARRDLTRDLASDPCVLPE